MHVIVSRVRSVDLEAGWLVAELTAHKRRRFAYRFARSAMLCSPPPEGGALAVIPSSGPIMLAFFDSPTNAIRDLPCPLRALQMCRARAPSGARPHARKDS